MRYCIWNRVSDAVFQCCFLVLVGHFLNACCARSFDHNPSVTIQRPNVFRRLIWLSPGRSAVALSAVSAELWKDHSGIPNSTLGAGWIRHRLGQTQDAESYRHFRDAPVGTWTMILATMMHVA